MVDSSTFNNANTEREVMNTRKPGTEPKEIRHALYNTKDGISASCETLEGLNTLFVARNHMGYANKEQLAEFIVLGRYLLDRCGNCDRIEDWVPKDKLPNIPDVLTKDEFWDYVKANFPKDDVYISISHSMHNLLPEVNDVCGLCCKRWTIADCYNSVSVQEERVLLCKPHYGKSYLMLMEENNLDPKFGRMWKGSVKIRNPEHVDRTPDPHDRGPGKPPSRRVKNDHGYMHLSDFPNDERNELPWDTPLSSSDRLEFTVTRYYHPNCYREVIEDRQYLEFAKLFQGLELHIMNKVPNEYTSEEEDFVPPWYLVETEYGKFKIGWRHSVINVDFSGVDSDIKVDILSLFADEDVTKSCTYIHAHGIRKAEEYLHKIFSACYIARAEKAKAVIN